MKNWKGALIFLVAGFILGSVAAFLFLNGRTTHKKNEMRTEVKIERITDTLRVEVPVPYKVRTVDTILVPVAKTTVVHDTTYLKLPREQKIYSDSTYRAVISGYLPRLDSMEVYRQTEIITRNNYIPPKRWSVGIGPTIGAGWVSSFGGSSSGIGIYAGIGVSFSYHS